MFSTKFIFLLFTTSILNNICMAMEERAMTVNTMAIDNGPITQPQTRANVVFGDHPITEIIDTLTAVEAELSTLYNDLNSLEIQKEETEDKKATKDLTIKQQQLKQTREELVEKLAKENLPITLKDRIAKIIQEPEDIVARFAIALFGLQKEKKVDRDALSIFEARYRETLGKNTTPREYENNTIVSLCRILSTPVNTHYIVPRGENIDTQQQKLVWLTAAYRVHLPCTKMLLEAETSFISPMTLVPAMIEECFWRNHWSFVNTLLQYGAPVNQEIVNAAHEQFQKTSQTPATSFRWHATKEETIKQAKEAIQLLEQQLAKQNNNT